MMPLVPAASNARAGTDNIDSYQIVDLKGTYIATYLP